MTILPFLMMTWLVLASASDLPGQSAFRMPGVYMNATGPCSAKISTAPVGGFARLHLSTAIGKTLPVDDITGAAFTDGALIYSVSPLYGRPGIFYYDCHTQRTRRVVSPKVRDRAYPDGADYFELVAVRSGRFFYYHAEDVDKADFAALRTPAHLFTAKLTGSGIRRATVDEFRQVSPAEGR